MKSEPLKLPPDPIVAELQAKLGRPLRVLHIGNIANNAYNNARIQRQYGIEADVICYDYYHIMSCPEWEDGSFTGNVEGNFPDWFATSLKGFSRPDWFVQGPAHLCLQYFRAVHLRMGITKRLLRMYLSINYFRIQDDFAALEGRKRPPLSRQMRSVAWLVEMMGLHDPVDTDMNRIADLLNPGPTHHAPLLKGKIRNPFNPVRDYIGSTINNGRIHLFNNFVIAPLTQKRFNAPGISAWVWLRRMRGHAGKTPQELAEMVTQEFALSKRETDADFKARLSLEKRSFVTRLSLAKRSFVHSVLRIPSKIIRWLYGLARSLFRGLVEAWTQRVIRKRSSIQIEDAKSVRFEIFKDRRSQLHGDIVTAEASVQEQVKTYADHHPLRFFDVMTHYDVVQGYSIDGFIPYMNGISRYAAYEHGTIRDLPWEPSLSGIVCARVYREAPLVFVTNSDVLPSVDRLGLAPEKVVYLPHAFDDAKLRAFRDVNPELQPPEGPAVFFSPTRHHWKDKSGSWTKGNDVFLRAAGLLAAEGHDFRLVLVEWGNEVPDSRELIDRLGLTSKVTWVPTKQKRELWEAYCRSHAVIDQFTLPALGGVGFETMALGRRLITALDEAQMIRFFGCPPPCLIAQSVEACRDRMREVVLDPDDYANRGTAARQWMIDYHSAQRIVSLQAKAYRDLMASVPAEPWRSAPC
ncbi:MAG: hypothetical protein ACKVON_14360 [Beijerinckiaceae bacterium]